MISIIIPTFNEEESITKLIEYLKDCIDTEEVELIISDGGSNDNTMGLARKAGAKVLKSPKKGRAAQMNEGAKSAKGEMLYFLHADSYPPKIFIKDIKKAVEDNYRSGCYRLAFDLDHPILKFYAWFTRFDIDYLRFGDQSLFVEKELFFKIGSFDEKLIVMEDQLIVREIKKEARFKILNGEVVTSARKYQKVGIIKLQVVFSCILILFYLGVSQENLVKFYVRSIN